MIQFAWDFCLLICTNSNQYYLITKHPAVTIMQKREKKKPGNVYCCLSVCPEKCLIQLINSTKEISAHKVLIVCLQIMAQACQALCEDQLC